MAIKVNDKISYFTLGATIVALLATLIIGLLPALLAGLLVYNLVEFGATDLGQYGVRRIVGKMILVLSLTLVVVGLFALAFSVVSSQLAEGPESFSMLLQRMADVIESARGRLPLWTQQYLPANIEEWQALASEWLRDNARYLGSFGKEAGHFLAHLLFGMIIGGLVALNPGFQKVNGPLAQAISDRIGFLNDAFRRIVFAQVRISALNTFLTALFLVAFLPMTGNPMPFTKALIAVTFFAGLLPIVGNLISNTVIFIVGLSVSPWLAVASLAYLVVIHKLEYFVNAHIIGTQIRSRAWEILLSMLVMESIFGLAGLVSAPIYYSYVKEELRSRKLI